jgi:hypothetical protein
MTTHTKPDGLIDHLLRGITIALAAGVFLGLMAGAAVETYQWLQP